MPVSIGLIAQTIEKLAPKSWAEEWDNVGLIVGNFSIPVNRVLLTLDGTLAVLQEAQELGAQLIIAHHPILFRPLKNLRSDNLAAQLPIQLIQAGIGYYAAHTNLDQSGLSSSWSFGAALGLQKMDFLSTTDSEKLVKLVTFVPITHVESVRQALVAAGVGEEVTDGPHGANYAECFFYSEGTGMFRPLTGANPAIGEVGQLTQVEEARLEGIMPERITERVIKALKKAHPYEEPAFDLIPLRNSGRPRGYGVIGYLPQPESLAELGRKINISLKQLAPEQLKEEPSIRIAGNPQQSIRKIAIVNGSGGSFIPKALFKGADLIIAGDIDHHGALDALEAGVSVMDIGHFWSEVPMIKDLADYLKSEKALTEVEILISERMQSPWSR